MPKLYAYDECEHSVDNEYMVLIVILKFIIMINVLKEMIKIILEIKIIQISMLYDFNNDIILSFD